MDNETINTEVETEEAGEELQKIENFDALWGEDEDFDGEAAEKAAAKEEEQEEPAAEEKAEEAPEKQEEEKPEAKQEAENQRFTLKHNGEESEVDRDKVIELAQKGMDYDRIKEERDRFKTDSDTITKLKAQESFLKELADSSGVTVEQLIENTRVRMLMGKTEGLSEEDARKQVREEASKAAEKKESEKAKEPCPEERRQAMFAGFLAAYPDVKAGDIPQEVWNDAAKTFDLVGAYQRYENRQLRKEIETLRQNNKNRERSLGSTKSVGSRTQSQAFDALWYDDDD